MSDKVVSENDTRSMAHDGTPTWRCAKAWRLLIFASIIALVTDLGSKVWAFQAIADRPVIVQREQVMAAGLDLEQLIPLHDPVVAIPNLLEFKLVLNPGAVFGMGAGKRWFFVVFTMLAIGFATWMFAVWTRPRDKAAHIAIALVLGGGLGNLYDRVIYACVRDFIHPLPGVKLPFGWSLPWGGREVWPYVSNLADLWLIIGILILVVYTFRTGAQATPAAKPEASL
ncbi:MAG: signal peptidase II [Planctomycetes bacterium]|nr:signal peptidase II [Planctomycetota bacterium]